MKWKPHTVKLETVNGTIMYDGYAIEILDVLAALLNFSYVLTEPSDGEWGTLKNGTWTGIVRQLQKREVDLFAGTLVMSPQREEVIDFTFPYFNVYSTVIFRLPDPNKSKWRRLIDPLKWDVRVSIFSSFVGIFILLYVMERFNPFYFNSRKRIQTFQEMALYLFGALLSQGGSTMPASSAGRGLLAAWWIFCLITVATYSGNLVAFLTVTKDNSPFTTISELTSQSEYTWGTQGGSIWVLLMMISNQTDIKTLWERTVEFNKTNPEVLQTDQNIHRSKVINENYGFIADITTAEMWVYQKCYLTYLKEHFFPINYCFALPNNSPYLASFSDEIMKITENGLMQTLKRKWWPKQNMCLEPSTGAKAIELVDFQSAFYVIGIGLVAALVAILVECCMIKNHKPISRQNNKSVCSF